MFLHDLVFRCIFKMYIYLGEMSDISDVVLDFWYIVFINNNIIRIFFFIIIILIIIKTTIKLKLQATMKGPSHLGSPPPGGY